MPVRARPPGGLEPRVAAAHPARRRRARGGAPGEGAATALRNLPHWALLFMAALVAGVIAYGSTQPF
ncbi:hypothetical protein ACFQ0O_31260 [Saccharopolyspora spinosporotrichia]